MLRLQVGRVRVRINECVRVRNLCVCARSPQAFTDPHPSTLKPLQPVKLVKMCAIFALLRVLLVNGVCAKCLRVRVKIV